MMLLSLSKFILLPIYSQWLIPSELCCLDSALCNAVERVTFLKSLHYSNLICNGLDKIPAFKNYLNWLTSKMLCIASITIDKPLTRTVQKKCLNNLKHLLKLEINNYTNSHEHYLYELSKECTELESLIIYTISRKNSLNDTVLTVVSEYCINLTSISLGFDNAFHSSGITDVFFGKLAVSFPKLTSVSLQNCTCITDDGIELLLEHPYFANQLQKLSLSHVRNCDIASLTKLVYACKSLTALELVNLPQHHDTRLLEYILTKCITLISLTLNPEDIMWTMNRILSVTPTLTLLTELRVTYVLITTEILNTLTFNCKQLKILSLDQQFRLHNLEVDYTCIAYNAPQLTELLLTQCESLNDSHLQVITEKCTNLKILDISNTNRPTKFTLEGLNSIVKHCRHLQQLTMVNLYGNKIMLPEELLCNIITNCTHLEVFDISHNALMDELIHISCDLFKVVKDSKLKELHAVQCSNVAPATIQLLKKMKTLQFIN